MNKNNHNNFNNNYNKNNNMITKLFWCKGSMFIYDIFVKNKN